MECDTPTSFNNSAAAYTDKTIDGQVTYTCHSDKYYPDGSTTRISICQHNTTADTVNWTPILEDCICKKHVLYALLWARIHNINVNSDWVQIIILCH